MSKVLCFAPRPAAAYLRGEPWPLLAACRCVAAEGHEVQIIQSVKGQDFKPAIREAAPGSLLLGISCMTGYPIEEALQASRVFKEANPGALVVWGGWHPSILAEQVLASPYVDVVVIGQGERTFLEIVRAAAEGRTLSGVLGTYYKSSGAIQKNPPRPFEDVNNFPPTPYHLIDVEQNLIVTVLGDRTLRYASSQGCPHRCGFCVEPTVFGRKWSGLKAERVVMEVEALVRRYGANGIIFTDSNFFVDPRRVRQIAALFIERGLDIRWGDVNGRTSQLLTLGEETWAMLKRSGLQSVLVGAESAMQEGLDLIKKDTSVEDTVNLSLLCGRHGVRITFSLMIGLPYNTRNRAEQEAILRKEYDSVIALIDQVHARQVVPNLFLLFIYTPYPGTPLYRLSVQLGMKDPASLEEWAHFDLNNRNTPWVPEATIERVLMLSEYIFRWLDDGYLAKLKKSKSILRPLLVLGGYTFTALSRLRWRLKFFGLPLDCHIFRFALKHRT